MKLSFRALLGLFLGATAVTACEYSRYSPGINTQFDHAFVNAPGWRNEDVNRDSINYKQNVRKPIGLGSATDIRTGSVQNQINSAPAGNSAASAQAPNGTNAAIDKNTGGNANTTDNSGASQNASGTKDAGQ